MSQIEPIRIHRAITKPVLWMDMERSYLIILGMLHGLLAYAWLSRPVVVIVSAVSAAFFFWLGKVMAKNDPQMISVISESLNYRGGWLAAHSHPVAPSAKFRAKK